ncbi:MAG: carboxypeptidase-like regulatory domain-containing protein [Salinivirgaceae bacterium]|jgi:hypothetical protein|nr:carboxypeptidase-like regulatory domain-containing protein [Salinivirgaceae bacterium]
MKKLIIVLVVVCVNQFYGFSQQINQNTIEKETSNCIIIKGKLTELVNNEKVVLPFANVFIEGTTEVTSTDFDGNFILKTEVASCNLKCTYRGYESVVNEINSEVGKTIDIEVLMKPEGTAMNSTEVASKS